MKILNKNLDFAEFNRRLRKASERVLLLDYDGTLAPFCMDPGKALPYAGVRRALNQIMRNEGIRVVIVTGRWIRDLKPLLQLESRPEIWGSHGLERLKRDGSYELAPMQEDAIKGLVAADELVLTGTFPARYEQKPGSVALHWRGLGEQTIAEIRDRIEPRWSLIAEAWGLCLMEFDGGLELRVRGRDKGHAVKTILEEMGEDTTAAYLGDDRTDEDAFRAIKGKGLGVLVRERPQPTAADIWMKPPEELLAFLADWDQVSP